MKWSERLFVAFSDGSAREFEGMTDPRGIIEWMDYDAGAWRIHPWHTVSVVLNRLDVDTQKRASTP